MQTTHLTFVAAFCTVFGHEIWVFCTLSALGPTFTVFVLILATLRTTFPAIFFHKCFIFLAFAIFCPKWASVWIFIDAWSTKRAAFPAVHQHEGRSLKTLTIGCPFHASCVLVFAFCTTRTTFPALLLHKVSV